IRSPRHLPRPYHVRSALSEAATATTMILLRLRRALPANAPAPSKAGITGTGRPLWLPRTQANRSHSSWSRITREPHSWAPLPSGSPFPTSTCFEPDNPLRSRLSLLYDGDWTGSVTAASLQSLAPGDRSHRADEVLRREEIRRPARNSVPWRQAQPSPRREDA